MSLQETKIADNFIYDNLFDTRTQDSNSTPFLKKNVAYVVDQQAGNGSYASGEVIIDSQAIAASGNNIDWRNGYIVCPQRVKWDVQFATAPGTITSTATQKFALAMKNCSLLDSLKVEANGKVILTATQGLSNLVNFKLLSTMTPASLVKEGPVIGFYPDSEGLSADGGADSINNTNDLLASSIFGDKTRQYNQGLIERQDAWLPSMNTSFLTPQGAKNECAAWDYGTTATSVTTLQTLSDISFVAIIRLKDIADYFDKHPVSRGVAYRFTLRFNQAITTLTQPSGTSFASSDLTITGGTQISGSVQPAMLCVGPSTVTGRMGWSVASAVTHTVTSIIDSNNAGARINGVRLYVPSYEMEPSHQEKLLSEHPVVKRSFMDFMTQTTQTYAGPSARINVQVSTSATNPRTLIVIPRWSQTGTGNSGQGFYSEASPLSTVPGTTDALLSLTNLQIKMGSTYVLPDRLYYTFQEYLDNLSSIFAVNGNQTVNTGGLISKKSFEVNNRYYAFDLSRYPQAMDNLPQMISLECDNNSAVAIELTCYLLYGRDAEWNLAQGSLTMTV